MLTDGRKRYNLMCSDSPESLVLERKPDHDTLYITLSTGTVTVLAVPAVLEEMYDLFYKWLEEPGWMFDSNSEQTLESKTIVHDGVPTVFVSVSRLSNDESSVSITSQGVTSQMTFSGQTYPHYDLRANMLHFLKSLKTAVSSIIEQLEY